MNHKQRRVAKYKKLGLLSKVFFAESSMNNRSRRARGKMRAKYWKWTGKPGYKFSQAITERRVGNLNWLHSVGLLLRVGQ